MKYEIKIKKDEPVLTLPRDRLLELLSECSESELKALIAITAEPDESAAAEIAGMETGEFAASLSFWRGAKLVGRQSAKKKAPPADNTPAEKKTPADLDVDELPEYTSADVVRLSREDALFHSILDEAQRTCGKVFNNTEMNYILAMRDHLSLDGEYILMLLEYFKREGKPLCYAVRVADSLVKKGVSTPKALEEYIKHRDSFKGAEGKYRELFGIGTRALTAYEEKYFTSWSEEMKIPFELVALAFDRTVEKKGAPKKSYMGGILKKWHEAGYRTADDVLTAEQQTRDKGETRSSAIGGATGDSTFDIDDFFNAALERAYGESADTTKQE